MWRARRENSSAKELASILLRAIEKQKPEHVRALLRPMTEGGGGGLLSQATLGLDVESPDGTVQEMDWSVLLEFAVFHPQEAQSRSAWDEDLMSRCVASRHPDPLPAGANGPDVKVPCVQNALLFVFRKILRQCGASMRARNHSLDYDGRYWAYVMGSAKRVWYAVVKIFWSAIVRLQNTLRDGTVFHVKFDMPGGIQNLQLDYHYYHHVMTPDWSREIRKEYRKNITHFLADYRADLMTYCKHAYGSHVSDDGASVVTSISLSDTGI
jgi:hypothetical protein